MKRLTVLLTLCPADCWHVMKPACGTANAVSCPPSVIEEGVGTALVAARICSDGGYCCVPITQTEVR